MIQARDDSTNDNYRWLVDEWKKRIQNNFLKVIWYYFVYRGNNGVKDDCHILSFSIRKNIPDGLLNFLIPKLYLCNAISMLHLYNVQKILKICLRI